MQQCRGESIVASGRSEMAAQRVTFAHQQSLPRLPVPDLQTTVARFLRSAEPLLSKDEVANLKAQAALFLSTDGMGATLQRRLLDRAADKVPAAQCFFQGLIAGWRGSRTHVGSTTRAGSSTGGTA